MLFIIMPSWNYNGAEERYDKGIDNVRTNYIVEIIMLTKRDTSNKGIIMPSWIRRAGGIRGIII